MNIELVRQAQTLYDKFYKLCWHYAQQQDEYNYKRVRRIREKASNRYKRRYYEYKALEKTFNSRTSTSTST